MNEENGRASREGGPAYPEGSRPSGDGPPRASLEGLRESEALGQLAGGMVHDLNNLLTATLAHLDLLDARLATGDPQGLRGDLQEMRQHALTGSRIAKHLLSFSRRERIQVQAVDLAEVTRAALELARPELPPGISVQAETVRSAPAVADPLVVERVVVSLIANARDAMGDEGRLGVTVTSGSLDRRDADRRGWGDPGSYGIVTISDTGRGMAPETVSRLFQPFFEATEAERKSGRGLSMAMIYGLMKQQRGFIEVDSEPGVGTTVRLYFRLQDQGSVFEAGGSESEEGEKGTVLFVEEDESLLDLACTILGANGFRAMAARNGRQALDRVERDGVPDLLVTDLVMPIMTGIDLLRHLDENGQLPPVLLTSSMRPEFLVGWHRDPADFSFLEKPWSVEDLLAEVQRLAQRPAGPGG